MSDRGPSVRLRYLGRLAELPTGERAEWMAKMQSLWSAGLRGHVPPTSTWPDALWDSLAPLYEERAFAHIATVGDELAGFQLISHRIAGRHHFVVIHVTVVREDLQGSNIGYALTTRSLLRGIWRERSLREFIVSRVYNPVALAGLYHATPDRSTFAPVIDPSVMLRPVVRDALAEYVATFYCDYDWDPTTSLISSASEATIPPFRQRSGDPLIDEWWDRHVASGGASALIVQEVSVRMFLAALPLIARAALRTLRLRRRGAHRRHEQLIHPSTAQGDL